MKNLVATFTLLAFLAIPAQSVFAGLMKDPTV